MGEAREEARPLATGAFPIVGIGASAGGLEAFGELLRHLAPDTGMGFVLVQHLAPAHASMLCSILSRTTSMPVREVTERTAVERDHVYVIPPNSNLALKSGVLEVLPGSGGGAPRMPIDFFFGSLAEDKGRLAIGVVLSGTASDGARGLAAIKEAGGVTFAEDPESAQYDGMPRAAIATGLVDFVLRPEEISRELGRLGRDPQALVEEEEETPTVLEADLRRILEILRHSTGTDLGYYKPANLHRRIRRRMLLQEKTGAEDYLEYLRENPAEATALHNDILIPVTSFFRDRETLEALKKTVFPAILEGRADHSPLRFWVPGCSSGEEAYSLAILIVEHLEEIGADVPVQVFASDLSDAAIAKARAGLYMENLVADLSPERLQRFFAKTDGGYQVAKGIRDLCIFARHNLVTDPPFSQLDLVSCCNVFIYLRPEFQRRIIELFYYALKPRGFLKLGRSETIGAFDESFTAVDRTSKIYVKKLRAARAPLTFGRAAQNSFGGTPLAGAERSAAVIVQDLRGEADRLLLERYAPVGVLVNEDMDIVEFRGRTVPYLEPAPGDASLNLLKMARGSLALDIRAACREARKQNARVRREGLQIDREGRLSTFNLEVIPMASAPARGRHFLVLFEERAQTSEIDQTKPSNEKATKRPARSESALLRRLRQELAATKQNLQAIIEELESANEELKSLNEEALSTNEELQSTNEELETAQEELQSTNEELMTVNDQLQSRNLEVTQISNDLENLLETVAAPILMLDQNVRIRRFTPTAAKTLDLIATDIGRHLGDLRLALDVSDLETSVLGVINSVSAKELEVRDRTGRWYSLRIHPYRISGKNVEGAVVMLFDVDDLKRSLDTAKAARQYAEAIIATVREPLLVLDASLRVVKANRSFYETFAVSPADTVQRLVYELGNHQWDIPKLRDLLERVLPEKSQFEGFEMEHEYPVIGLRKMILNARQIRHEGAGDQLILLAIQDVTEHARAEEALRVNEEHSRRLADAMPEMAWSARPDGYVDYYNERWYEFTRLPRGEWGDASWVPALDPEHVERVRQGWYGGALLSGERFEIEARFRDPAAGGYRWHLIRADPARDEAGQIVRWFGTAADIEQQKRAEEALEEADRRKDEFLAILAHELRNPLAPIVSSLDTLRTQVAAAPLEKQAWSVIDRQVGRLTRLVDDLLDISRVTRGKLDLQRRVMDLTAVAASAVESVRPQFAARGHELTLRLPPEPVRVFGDPARLEQVLTNVLTNAARYTLDGGHIALSVESAGGDAILRVKDDGIGIPSEMLSRIFIPFTQVESSTSRGSGGLGIGLAVVRMLVELHGGSVDARSPGLGQGTEIIVRLPTLSDAQPTEEPSTEAPARILEHTSRRILIVDDNADAAESLASALELSGHRVSVAYDGPSAIEVAIAERPDVIFLDIGLPGMDGYEVAAALRQRAELCDARIVAITGYGQDRDRQRTRDAGFDQHIVKPVNLNDLWDLLERRTERRS